MVIKNQVPRVRQRSQQSYSEPVELLEMSSGPAGQTLPSTRAEGQDDVSYTNFFSSTRAEGQDDVSYTNFVLR